jgi:hypothetical protein
MRGSSQGNSTKPSSKIVAEKSSPTMCQSLALSVSTLI